jgi:nucleotide-binding universal stress UspA family protein
VAVATVLVAVDETPASYTAVDHAAIEADLHGWNLRLFHVQHPGGLHQPSRDDGAGLLEQLTDRVHACAPSVAVTSRLAVGSPASLVLSAARDTNLVVVGHRHGPVSAAFGRSVGDRVAAQHNGVVMVVRMPGWPAGPEFGKLPLVVGIDPARSETPAVDFALREAAVRGCEVVMLHAGKDAASAARAETIAGVPVHHRTVADDPVAALLESSSKAAALVVGRRSPGGPPGSLLSWVNRAMVQRASCPVFLVG